MILWERLEYGIFIIGIGIDTCCSRNRVGHQVQLRRFRLSYVWSQPRLRPIMNRLTEAEIIIINAIQTTFNTMPNAVGNCSAGADSEERPGTHPC